MIHKIIGNKAITTPFFRFTTDSGSSLDPRFVPRAASTYEWISPDGSISTAATPNPALSQTGVYTVKCSDWSDVRVLEFNNDHVTTLDNLHVLTTLESIYAQDNSISVLDVSMLTTLTVLSCGNNNMDQTNIDKILADLVTAGVSNGTASMAGTNAAPSAVGLANKVILEGRGWTITVSA